MQPEDGDRLGMMDDSRPCDAACKVEPDEKD
jgi:hypothetical protein